MAVRRIRELGGGIRVASRSMPAGELGWHDHGAATLCVVAAGATLEEDHRGIRDRGAGDVALRVDPERHRNRVGPAGVTLVTLELERTALAGISGGRLSTGPAFGVSGPARALARRVLDELSAPDDATDLVLQGLVLEMTAAVLRLPAPSATRPPWLPMVLDHLRTESRPMSLAELAGAAGVPAHRLCREVRRHEGTTVGELVRRARLDRALDLLVRTDAPLAQIAHDAGYCDQSHLSNSVRRATGASPGAIRRRARGSR